MPLTLLLAAPAMADELRQPLPTANRAPLVQVHGLPATRSAELLSEGKLALRVLFEAANNFSYSSEGTESIVIDGENYRATLQLRYGLGARWELGLSVPYLSHEGGGLDGFIEDWHDTFSLPNGNRHKAPRDRLLYQYSNDGQTLINVSDSSSGVGDTHLSLAYQLAATETRRWALHAGVKLPTGDVDALRGSEATDVYTSLNLSQYGLMGNSALTFHGSIGALWLGDGEVISSRQEETVVYGSLAVNYQINQPLSLTVQLDGHTAFYNSELREIGNDSAQLLLGGSYQLTPSTILDLSISEDIVVETASDVIFQLGIRTSL